MRIRPAALLLAASLVVAAAVPAGAKDGDVIRRGTCSAASTWKLKLSPDDAGIETELQVDENVAGHKWRVRLYQDGDLVDVAVRTTKAPSGAFTLRRILPDTAGDDRVRARARNLATDELCVARATLVG